ncbi:MAG: hypothetical protein IH598_04710 [Bacteroidales bacterium]|nr:hypothetical protein [Bacteroidales bacterium]
MIVKLNENAILGLGELEGLIPKYFESTDNNVKLFVWGDLFIKDKDYADNNSKYSAFILLWDRKRETVFDEITGSYVVFIADNNLTSYYLFNSSFGMMPLYYSISGDQLLFSSRLKSFIDIQSHHVEIDKTGLLHYMMLGYPLGERSFLENVKLLPAATLISSTVNQWKVDRYDNHSWLLTPPSVSFKQGTAFIDELFEKAIRRISSLCNNFGIAITGGWDGRLILSYMTNREPVEFFLYTYGKNNHIDMKVAQRLAAHFNFKHIPVFLDDNFVRQYEALAKDSLLLSDGIRPANRSHYLMMAKILAEETNFVLSGNCGSNIMKIVQAPGVVYNKYLFRLFANSLEQGASDAYNSFAADHQWIKPLISKDDFIGSVMESGIIKDLKINNGSRFYHYLLTNVERKYFGYETAAYASHIYNYTPFMDAEFLKGILTTPFYGGHYNFLEKNPNVRYHLSRLYADLMVRRHNELAKFTSDRGFPITWFRHPAGRIAGFFKKKYFMKFLYEKDDDPFSHLAGMKEIKSKWSLLPDYFNPCPASSSNETYIRAISWSKWYSEIG